MLLATVRKKRQQRTRRSESGASLVEAALILPLFLFLILGIIEVSLYLLDTNAVRNGSRQAARVASTAATDAFADLKALRQSRQSLSNMTNSVDAMIIYRAVKPSDSVPAECLAALESGQPGVATATAACNIYDATKYRTADQLNFGFDLGSNNDMALWDRFWAPTGRNDSITEAGGADFVGVWVRVQHESLTGLIPKRALTSNTVFQIEPQRAL
jgi:TadE-like protein